MKTKNESMRPTARARDIVAQACRAADAENRAPRVLFVCLGNICRSPAAHGITESLAASRGVEVECDSAGFYGGHAGDLPDRRMREAAFARGYRLEHRARRIRSYDLDDFDIVIGMDDNNISDLNRLADTCERERKIVFLRYFRDMTQSEVAARHPEYDSVPDPYYEGAAGFQLVLDLLEDACGELVTAIEDENRKLKGGLT